jgi:hypothetical protein
MIKLGQFARSGSAGALAVALALTVTSPALAGEITGNGEDITINANSLCAYSGINDTPDGLWLPIGPGGALVQVDPGGLVQSYGYFLAQKDFAANPSDPAVRDRAFGFPGLGCNPVK